MSGYMLRGMTQSTMMAPAQESLSQRTSRRLRGALAENRISGVALARALHLPQQTVSRKVNGQTPFTLDELELVSAVLGIELDRLMGIGEYEDRPIGLCAIRDSNPEPADSEPRPVLQLVGPRPFDFRVPIRIQPNAPRRHLALVGGAA